MNLQVIHEHTVDLDLLHRGSNVLDLGCRGFQFEQSMRDIGCSTFTVDIDELPDRHYHRCAISNFDGYCGVHRNSDPQATRIRPGNEVPCYKLETFSKMVGVDSWDLIKMDVEGAEYEIIMGLEKTPAKQLSIEFHLHTGIYGMYAVQEMEIHLRNLGYKAVQHFQDKRHGLSLNYWDSLFILMK